MGRKVEYNPFFFEDLFCAGQRFEEEKAGLGERFSAAIQATLPRVIDFPESCPFFKEDLRRAVVHEFGFLVIYRATPGSLSFVGIVHGARDVDRWLKRRAKT